MATVRRRLNNLRPGILVAGLSERDGENFCGESQTAGAGCVAGL